MIGHGSTNAKALKISAVLIFLYFIIEIAVALSTGSLSLLADAAHELSTVVAIGISLIAMRLMHQKATPTSTYGLQRAETIAALVNGILLLGMAVFIILRGVQRLTNPVSMDSTPMFAMAIGGIGLEIASLIIMYKGQKENLNIRGSFWHVVNAFLGSIAVIIAATFIAVAGIYEADTWAGLLFAIILIYAAFGIIRDSLRILADRVPGDIDMNRLEADLVAIDGVTRVHHLHARTIGGGITSFSGHLVSDDASSHQRVLTEAKHIVEGKYAFGFSTIQIEPEAFAEMDPREIEYQDKAD